MFALGPQRFTPKGSRKTFSASERLAPLTGPTNTLHPPSPDTRLCACMARNFAIGEPPWGGVDQFTDCPRLVVQWLTGRFKGVTMRDPIERFGRTLLQQQTGLCEEWRKANPDTVVLPVLPWHREARDFHGVGLLTGHAWLRLRDWWRRPK
jgi:hypothetical protein